MQEWTRRTTDIIAAIDSPSAAFENVPKDLSLSDALDLLDALRFDSGQLNPVHATIRNISSRWASGSRRDYLEETAARLVTDVDRMVGTRLDAGEHDPRVIATAKLWPVEQLHVFRFQNADPNQIVISTLPN